MIGTLHIIITLIASLAITIVSLFWEFTFIELASRLIVIIPVFMVIGVITKAYIIKTFMIQEDEMMPAELALTPEIESLEMGSSLSGYDEFDEYDEGMDLEPQYIEGIHSDLHSEE